MTTAAVILAAGGGSRFDGPTHKLLQERAGRALVTAAATAALEAGLDELVVVQGAVEVADLVPAEATVVVNHDWEAGQATSLQCAIDLARGHGHGAVVVGLGDEPTVAPEAWRRVAAADGTPIAVAVYGGRRGHPVRLGAEVWDLLPRSGDTGARSVMAERPHLVTEVACAGDPFDIDTVEDLSRWS